MNRSHLIIASVLILLVIVIPCTEWYIVGSRDVSREMELFETQQTQKAKKAAKLFAGRLSEKLESLIVTESPRPFYHYQYAYYPFDEATAGSLSIPSPLNGKPVNSLVQAYFQWGPEGKVGYTSEDILLSDQGNLPRHLQEYLELVAPACFTFANNLMSSFIITKHKREIKLLPKEFQKIIRTGGVNGKIEILKKKEWELNQISGNLAPILTGGRLEDRNHFYQLFPFSKLDLKPDEVVMLVTPFSWYAFSLNGVPRLAALRAVGTPEGMLTQGFLISTSHLKEILSDESFSSELVYKSARKGKITSVVPGISGWYVSVDPTPAIQESQNNVHQIHTRFMRVFLIGVLVSSLAGLSLVGLVLQAGRLARQRSILAASAAHELKTPLAGLRLYGEMLAEGLGDPVKMKSYARRIADEAERLGRVVTNIIYFSGLERGSFSVIPIPGDLGKTVEECVERLRTVIETSGAKLELSMAGNLPEIPFDKDAVYHLLQNLLDNAEKYTRQSEDRTIRVLLEKDDQGVRLSVIDRGPGIPAAMRRSIFRSFARGKNQNDLEGLGLGLSLSQALAEAHGTRIVCQDNPLGGAIFSVVFPFKM